VVAGFEAVSTPEDDHEDHHDDLLKP